MAKTKSELSDELGGVIADSINKKFKASNIKTAYFLEGDSESPTIVHEWVSSGSTMLDLAISNRKYGGFPVGRISEISGLQQSGKSLLCAHVLANTQKMGGLAVFIDTENAVSKEFFSAVGVDLSKMMYLQVETIEDSFDAIDVIINKVRESGNDKLVTIVLDSIAGASTKVEMEKDFDKDGYATTKSIVISKAMRKITNLIGRERICLIFTNQLRQKMNAQPFADPYTTPGGHSVPFHSSVRIRLSTTGAIKGKVNGVEQVIGAKVRAKIVKNRVGPPQRESSYEMYFDSGIDDYSGWLTPMKDYGIVTGAGAHLSWTNKRTGEVIKFNSKDFVSKILDDPKLKEDLYDEICEAVIMKYTSLDAPRIDDVIITNESLLDED